MAHALLVHLTSTENSGRFVNFDECVEDIVYASSEVIFGESGKDFRSEGFKTTLREVRSSLSEGLDSFSILAKHIWEDWRPAASYSERDYARGGDSAGATLRPPFNLQERR